MSHKEPSYTPRISCYDLAGQSEFGRPASAQPWPTRPRRRTWPQQLSGVLSGLGFQVPSGPVLCMVGMLRSLLRVQVVEAAGWSHIRASPFKRSLVVLNNQVKERAVRKLS